MLRLAADRVQALVNKENSGRGRSMRNNQDRYNGYAETLTGTYTHIAVLGRGAPRILWTSTQDYNSKEAQVLLGWVFRNADPSGAPQPFWKGSRADLLKYHAWRWTKKHAPAKDGKDHFRSFSVYEDRDTGAFEVIPCEGTESKNDAASIAAAQKKCVTKFTKDTNPVRSEDKNVRGFFVSGTKFIFSKHEETTDASDLNKGEIPAIGTLGRWILKNLLPEYTRAALQGSMNAGNKDLIKYEGNFHNTAVDFWVAAHVKTEEGDRLEVYKQRKRALGQVEDDQLRTKPWWLAADEGPNTFKT